MDDTIPAVKDTTTVREEDNNSAPDRCTAEEQHIPTDSPNDTITINFANVVFTIPKVPANRVAVSGGAAATSNPTKFDDFAVPGSSGLVRNNPTKRSITRVSPSTNRPSKKIRSEGSDSSHVSEDRHQPPEEKVQRVKYGELVILGNNGSLPQGDKGRRRNKLVLYKREKPNGIKRSKHYPVKSPLSTQAILDTSQHSISYTLNRSHAIIVEYMPDEETDMFQIGRSSEAPIDFVVMDTVPGGEKSNDGGKILASTISRFACRILANRNNPTESRIYAAGFDSSKNIFLGEKATKWQEENHDIDGLTTNGVLIMHPQGQFFGGDAEPGIWKEVSVEGGVYTLRESRSAQQKGKAVEGVSNVLQDGTLIDLCGATLLWRSAEGLKNSPTKEYLEKLVDQVNAERPMCPVGLNTLVIPRKSNQSNEKQPYVYLNCGHVQGLHDWGVEKGTNSRTCSMCFKSGPTVKLSMGIEPAFYVDSGPPNFYAFNPCGHIATEKTVKYWAIVQIPHGTSAFDSFCPFCATPLQGYPGYVKLIFN